MPDLEEFYTTWEKILTDQFLLWLEKINIDPGSYFDSYQLAITLIWIMVGLLLNYAGLKAHKLILPIAFGAAGGFFAALIVSKISQNENYLLIATIATGIICAGLSLFIARISFVLIGVVFGLGVATVAGYQQIIAYAIFGVVFGIIAWLLYNFTIILITGLSGSFFLTYGICNLYVLVQSNYMKVFSNSLLEYANKIIRPILNPSDIADAFDHHLLEYIIFILFLLTGFTFQYGINLLPSPFKKKKTKPKSKLKPLKKPLPHTEATIIMKEKE